MKKIKLHKILIIIGCVGMIGLATTWVTLTLSNKNNIIKKDAKSPQLDNLTEEIIKDISSNSLSSSLQAKYSIHFNSNYAKKLFTLGIPTSSYNRDVSSVYNFSKLIDIDYENLNAKINLQQRFNHIFKDPDPLWCDPAGLKWPNKEVTLETQNIELNTKLLLSKEYWFGDTYSLNFNYNGSNSVDDNISVHYNNHSYFTHYITYRVNGSYYFGKLDENKIVTKFNKINLIKLFIESIPINGDEILNQQTANRNKLVRFNKYFTQLKTLSYAKNILDYLTNFIAKNTVDGQWINLNIKKKNIDLFIDDILKYKFISYDDLKIRYEKLMDNKNSLFIESKGNFIIQIKELYSKLIENDIIPKSLILDFNKIEEIYNIALLYFRNNEIKVNLDVNGHNLDLVIWDGIKFLNILNEIPQQLQFESNTIKLKVNTIDSSSINNNNNQIFYFPNISIKINKNFIIKYRWDALNINPKIKKLKLFKEGLLINSNKYLSELMDNENFLDNNSFLKLLNNTLFNIDVINGIDLLSNKNLYNESIDIEEFYKFYNLGSTNKKYNFDYSDDKGEFFVILNIKDLFYNDGTNGNFNSAFLPNLLSNLNAKYNTLFHINKKESTTGTFIIKLLTNKIKNNL